MSVVEGVRFGSRCDRPDVLIVRAGLFGRCELAVPVEAVQVIVPRKYDPVRVRANEEAPDRTTD
jgi:hypothetical protein